MTRFYHSNATKSPVSNRSDGCRPRLRLPFRQGAGAILRDDALRRRITNGDSTLLDRFCAPTACFPALLLQWDLSEDAAEPGFRCPGETSCGVTFGSCDGGRWCASATPRRRS